mmetsp:Transcript_24946/g.78402  ORF Transcript_24946/g.78402 Transcript_24946/m.78402 type:complete len:234 (-) Transcript_24946:151-852(-)
MSMNVMSALLKFLRKPLIRGHVPKLLRALQHRRTSQRVARAKGAAGTVHPRNERVDQICERKHELAQGGCPLPPARHRLHSPRKEGDRQPELIEPPLRHEGGEVARERRRAARLALLRALRLCSLLAHCVEPAREEGPRRLPARARHLPQRLILPALGGNAPGRARPACRPGLLAANRRAVFFCPCSRHRRRGAGPAVDAAAAADATHGAAAAAPAAAAAESRVRWTSPVGPT